ncbi:MAG: hypothetical protein GXP48_07005 [Acidobacteria bacterium]|nr:hypothetical protein [Acidobacteriota bacterium]
MKRRRFAIAVALTSLAIPVPAAGQSVPLDTGLLALKPGAFELGLAGTRIHGASFHVDWKGAGELPGDLNLDESIFRLRAGLTRRLALRLATAWRRNAFLSERMGETSTSGPAWTEVGLEWAPLGWQHRHGGMRLGVDVHVESRREGFFPVRSGRGGANLWLGLCHGTGRWGTWLRLVVGYRSATSQSPHDMGFVSAAAGASWTTLRWLRLGLIADAGYASNSVVGGAVMFNHPAYAVRTGFRVDLIHLLPATELSLTVDRHMLVHSQTQGVRVGASVTLHLGGHPGR